MFIGQHLKLDVTWILDELLHVKFTVAKSVGGFGCGGMEQVRQIVCGAHNSHAASATACLGLQNDREAHLLRPHLGFLYRLKNAVGARQDGHSGPLHRLAGLFLLAHQARHFGRRSDELDV